MQTPGKFIMVRTVLSLIFLMAFSLSAAAQSNRALHDRLITFDAEMDIPYEFMTGPNDVGQDTAMQVDLPKMDRGGLDGALFVSWVSQGERTPSAYAKAKADADIKFKAIEAMVEKYGTYNFVLTIYTKTNFLNRIYPHCPHNTQIIYHAL